ncbi:MAG: hypothetical protein HY260_13450 [Chloroflexi bacterium]|nr:hypothetical protein [Chloroflexota bacterium]
MTACPSCGNDAGDSVICPHCGASVRGPRLPLTALKIGAVVLAAVGLIGLYAAAKNVGVPDVKIAQVGATMNLAYVRVSGLVTRQPTYDLASQYLSFRLDDGTGEISVSAYRAETLALVNGGKVPALGDRVTVEGTLRVREDFSALTINAPERVVVERPEAVKKIIGQIQPTDANTRVTITGQVADIREPYPGLTIFSIRDDSGGIDLTIGQEVAALTGPLPEVHEGEYVAATGVVSLYRDAPQVTLTSSADIALVADPGTIAEARTTGSLQANDENRLVQIAGVIGPPQPFAAGVQFSLDDGSGAVTLLLWQDLFDAINAGTPLAPGLQVRLIGRVKIYRDEVEVAPEAASDVEVLGIAETLPPAPTPQPEVSTAATPALPEGVTPIAEVKVSDRPTLQGLLANAESYAGGFKFALNDGTGTITLLLPEATYKSVAGLETLRPGAMVRVTGDVKLYRGEFEIVPAAGSDVTILTPGHASDAVPTPVGRLSLGDLDKVLSVEGAVSEVVPFSAGKKIILDDGTGTVTILLWQNVYNFVPNTDALTPGTKVRATGVLNEFRGDLEIIPQLGFDVIVNP